MSSTILDAVVTVLKSSPKPLSSGEIYALVVERQLFTFGAKDPKSVLRAAIRKHIRAAASGGGSARVKEAGPDRYAAA